MVTRVLNDLSDPDGKEFDVSKDVVPWLNMGYEEIILEMNPLRNTYIFSSVDDQEEYSLPDDLFMPEKYLRYYDGSNTISIPRASEEFLDEYCSGWRDTTKSTPTYFYIKYIQEVGLRRICFYPKPDYAGTNNCTFLYFKKGGDLWAQEEQLQLSPGLINAIIRYAVREGKRKKKDYVGSRLEDELWLRLLRKNKIVILKERYTKLPRMEVIY